MNHIEHQHKSCILCDTYDIHNLRIDECDMVSIRLKEEVSVGKGSGSGHATDKSFEVNISGHFGTAFQAKAIKFASITFKYH